MVETPERRLSGLREQKKARTRRVLINVAVDLCLEQGYDDTTVEQIAVAAEVSTRTFSRYFPSKDAVFIAVLDDLADVVAAELTAQPTANGPLEALRAAHVSVLARVAKRPWTGLTTERIALILRIVYSSPVLRQAAIDYRSAAAMAALARHMGVAADDPNLELGVSLFSTAIVSACDDLVAGNPKILNAPELIIERLEQTLGQVADFAADLNVSNADSRLATHALTGVRDAEAG